MSSRTTRFCLVRHGETAWNAEKRIQGQIDIPLNATGESQARALRAGLRGHRFGVAYSSDLWRAWRTAELATAGLDIPVLPALVLRERHYGVFQGLTAAEAQAAHPEAHRHHLARTPDYDFDCGESLVAFAARVSAGLDGLARRHPGASVLVFTHGGVLDIVHRQALGRDLQAPRDFPIPNAALNWLTLREGAWAIDSWADRRHLEREPAAVLEDAAE